MNIRELSREQLKEVKCRAYEEAILEKENRNVSMGEMCNIDEIVTDEEIYATMNEVEFTDEDFFGTSNSNAEYYSIADISELLGEMYSMQLSKDIVQAIRNNCERR